MRENPLIVREMQIHRVADLITGQAGGDKGGHAPKAEAHEFGISG